MVSLKGQLISKGLFAILNSSKKRTKKIDFTTLIPQVELFSFSEGIEETIDCSQDLLTFDK